MTNNSSELITWRNKLLEKNFIVTLVSQIIGFLLMWNGKIDDGVWSTVTIAVTLAFLGSEVYNKFNKE